MNARAISQAASLVLVVGLAAGSAFAQAGGDNTRRGLTRGGGGSNQPSQPAQDPPPQQPPPPQPPPQQPAAPQPPPQQPAAPPPPAAPAPAQAEPSRPAQAAAPSSGLITPRLPSSPGANQQYRRPNNSDGTTRGLTSTARPAPRAPRLPETVRFPSGIETSRAADTPRTSRPAAAAPGQSIGRRMFGGTPQAASAASVPMADAPPPAFDHTRRGLVRASPPPAVSGNSNDYHGPGHYDPPRRGRRGSHGHPYYRPITTVYTLPWLFGPIPSIAGGWGDTSQFGYRDYGGFTYPPLFGPQYAEQDVRGYDRIETFDWYGRGLYAWDNSAGYGPEPYIIEIPAVGVGVAEAISPAPLGARAFTVSSPSSGGVRASTRINTAYDVSPDFHASIDAAAQGEFSTAIFAMRRAAGVNPGALVGTQSTIAPTLAEDLAAAQRVRFALQTFQNPPQRVVSEADAKFMVAALHGALGDRPSAAAAARSALAAGDASLSTMLLDRAIRGERLDDSGPWVTGRPLQK